MADDHDPYAALRFRDYRLVLAGSVLAGGGLKSGPPVGSHRLLPFNPLNVTGENAGEKVCQV